MTDRRDPVEEASGRTRDLYDIATWERRSILDRLSGIVYLLLSVASRVVVALLAALVLIAQLVGLGVGSIEDPYVLAFVLLSIVPALGLALYVWKADVTMREPLWLLALTFSLGVLFAAFAAILNSAFQPLLESIPLVGMAFFFYLVVGPVEETVKWLAVRVFAYKRFNAVIDGAVYGAMAGLGFAAIENLLYISQQYLTASQSGLQLIGVTAGTAALRTFAGPGHVIYSAFAGYYLGLARFNPENRGPIVVKGLLIAAFIHGTYNTLVTYLPPLIIATTGLTEAANPIIFIVFVFVYDGIFGYLLYRKLSRYRVAYRDAEADRATFAFDGDGTTDEGE